MAKGTGSQQVTDACKKAWRFLFRQYWRPAAILAQDSIKSFECCGVSRIGMEAIWKIEVEDFPAFILVDDRAMISSR
jgi:fumarate hydratase class I